MTDEALIYLDGFATMPLSNEARDAMIDAWQYPANAGSPHRLGERAASIIANARASIADLIGAAASEIIFTSGATEADNLIVTGLGEWALAGNSPRRCIVVSAVEHKAVLEPVRKLEHRGFSVIFAPVDRQGVVDLEALAGLVDEQTLLVSLMLANNETGAIQPVAEAAQIARRSGSFIHVDAAQAAGKIAIDVLDLDLDYLSLSAHKMYGPPGIGACFVSAMAPRPVPLFFGGGQQGGSRPGTEPTALIAGFGAAAKAAACMIDDAGRVDALATRFVRQLESFQLAPMVLTGDKPVLPGSRCLMLSGVDCEELVSIVSSSVCISTGSSCTSGQLISSHVLKAMSISDEQCRNVFRIYINKYLMMADIDRAADEIAAAAIKLKSRTGRNRQWDDTPAA